MGTFVRRWVPVLSLAAVAAVPARAQRIDPDRIFEVTVEVNGRMMSAMIREGSFLRLTVRETDEYHFSPVLQPGNAGRALVAVSLGTAGQPQTRRVVERLVLSPGVPVTLRTAPTLRIVLDEISRARQDQASTGAAGSGAPFRFASAQAGQCCVCCEGACACACGVSMWCGHCCTQGCCDPMLPTGQDRIHVLTGPARFASFTRGGGCTRGSLLERARTPGPAGARIALR